MSNTLATFAGSARFAQLPPLPAVPPYPERIPLTPSHSTSLRAPRRPQVALGKPFCSKLHNKRSSHPQNEAKHVAARPRRWNAANQKRKAPSTVDSHSSPDDEARFVGNLNPESTFLADSHKTSGTGYAQSDPIGVWVARRMTTDDASPRRIFQVRHGPVVTRRIPFSPALEQLLHTLPSPRHYEGLKAIYLRDVHRLFPVFDLAALDKPESTVAQVLTKQAVCLAAGAHVDARALLTLGPDADPERPLTYAQFSLRLSWAMRSLLGAGLVKDRVQIIPVYVILALYTYGLEDRQVTIEMASLAVSHVFTIGLQLQIPDSRSENPGYLATLFCCVWAMDQMNACIHGRPLMMHERDFGRDLRACIAQQEPGFRLLLETVELLDRAIELYRPGSIDLPNELVKELPTFENLIEKSGAVALDTRHPFPRLAVSSYITAQQSLSSVSITTIVEDMGDQLPCVTFLPYALSLSLRVAYRELRASKVPMLRGRSYRQLQTNCRIIRGFSGIYRPVLAIVGLVDKLLEEIDRVGQEAAADSAAQTPTPRPLDPSTGREQVPNPVVHGNSNEWDREGYG
ncbi:unnamed protein product [Parascedosporium putredinis]|uniref:Transcription factor domain-containing protein n=1 Tax=Parascedosporium putredinis TaxID=1442378 RepID=A0A9P1H6R6_9PEZI|nr:unnamed protein product [Parascedosporium putredinis]CAI8000576.1 unnamed protein product [Parascedosporium putredinis]